MRDKWREIGTALAPYIDPKGTRKTSEEKRKEGARPCGISYLIRYCSVHLHPMKNWPEHWRDNTGSKVVESIT